MRMITNNLKKEINELSSKEFLSKYKDVIVYEKTQLKRDSIFFMGSDEPYRELPDNYYELIPSEVVILDGFPQPVYDVDTLVINTQQLKAINPTLSADDILIGVYRIYCDIVDTNKIIETVETIMNTDCSGVRTKRWKRDDSYWCYTKKELSWQARQGFARKYRACKQAGIDLNLTIEENSRITGVPVRRIKEWNESLEIGLKSEKEINNQKLEDLIRNNPTLSDRKLVELASEQGLKTSKSTINRLRNKLS